MEAVLAEHKTTNALPSMNNVAFKTATLITRAVNHKLRKQIIALLDEQKRMHVSDIYAKLKLQQSVTSQHLALMRRAGIVLTNREGRNIYYLLNYKRLAEIGVFADQVGTAPVEQ